MAYGPKPQSLAARFWEKVEQRGPNECWLWKGCTNGVGYGMILKGKTKVLAHRVSWELSHGGTIPDGMIVMHEVCDNPSCVNPKHLTLGTHRQNMEDRSRKKRDNHVDNFGKLNAASVKAIVSRYLAGETQTKIASAYDISGPTVSQIIRGKIWAHVTKELNLPARGRRNLRARKLTDDQIKIGRDHG